MIWSMYQINTRRDWLNVFLFELSNKELRDRENDTRQFYLQILTGSSYWLWDFSIWCLRYWLLIIFVLIYISFRLCFNWYFMFLISFSLFIVKIIIIWYLEKKVDLCWFFSNLTILRAFGLFMCFNRFILSLRSSKVSNEF